MTTTQSAQLLTILQEAFTPREDGWLWVATYRDDVPGGVVQEITGEYEDAVDTARALAEIVTACGADSVYLALCRRDARPTGGDRDMWRALRDRLDPTTLTDMVIFNRREVWSMRAEDAAVVN